MEEPNHLMPSDNNNEKKKKKANVTIPQTMMLRQIKIIVHQNKNFLIATLF